MKTISACIALSFGLSLANAEPLIDKVDFGTELVPSKKHAQGSEEVAEDQDELSADVSQLILEQTNPKVNELLSEVENIMDEATEMLIEHNTGGATIAAQTEIIEKIHEAAKEKQKQSGCQAGGAMMDMMEKMMGQGQGQGQKPGQGQGKGGQGQTGDSDTANTEQRDVGTGPDETRRIPKASGNDSIAIPEEYRGAFDAYNRGAEKLIR